MPFVDIVFKVYKVKEDKKMREITVFMATTRQNMRGRQSGLGKHEKRESLAREQYCILQGKDRLAVILLKIKKETRKERE